MATPLTDLQAIKMMLRTVTGRINAGEADPAPGTNEFDISNMDMEQLRMSAETEIEARLSRFYSIPLAQTNSRSRILIKQIATKLAAYSIWQALNPSMTIDRIPVAVLSWKADADSILEQIVPKGKDVPVAGRDIILDGESLLVGTGTRTVPEIAFTTKLPWGGAN